MNLLLVVLAITLPSFSYQEGLEQFSKEVKCLGEEMTFDSTKDPNNNILHSQFAK